jgi:hypothetical protein
MQAVCKIAHQEQWIWAEAQFRATRTAAALAELRLERLVQRRQRAKAARDLASQLRISASEARSAAFLTGDMARFSRADEAMRKAIGRQGRAEGLLSALWPEIDAARRERHQLEAEAARWEEAFWHHTTRWFMSVWTVELRAAAGVNDFLAWYCAFRRHIRDQLDAELDVFARTVQVLTRTQ